MPRPITSRIMSNRQGLSEDPWCRPTLTVILPVTPILVRASSYVSFTWHTSFSGAPCSLKHLQTSCRGTLSYAFSINTIDKHNVQFLLHLPVFHYHMPRCKYDISYPFAQHETELLFSYSCLLPQSSVDYSFSNLHYMIYHLDASVIPTILDNPFSLTICTITLYRHSVGIFPARKSSGADPTTYLPLLLPSSTRHPLEFHLVPSPFHV